MIIVIGATGFIGTYLIDQLVKEGVDVLASGRSKAGEEYYKNIRVPFIRLDITKEEDFNELPTKDVKAVVLLAALLPANVQNYNPVNYININIIGTANVLEYCRKNGINKFVSTTTYADVQKSWDKEKPIRETANRSFRFTGDHAMYVISKNASTDIIEHYSQEYEMQGIVFRLPPVYGYGPHSEIYVDGKYYKSGFQIFIEKATKGETIELWGDSTVTRDVVYVKDVVSAFISALKSDKARGLYNIASGVPLSLDEQVKIIIRLFSHKENPSEIVYLPDKKNASISYIFDITKARKDFGYIPNFVPFEKMLIDIKKEIKSGRFNFLIENRRKGKNN